MLREDSLEDVLAHPGVEGAERVVHEVGVGARVKCPRQVEPLSLTSAQVDALQGSTVKPVINGPCFKRPIVFNDGKNL